MEVMEPQATPLATQPFFDPRRRGTSLSASSTDAADIILILHPTTPTAIEAVRATAQLSPQHIRYHDTVSPFVDEDVDLEPLPIPGHDAEPSETNGHGETTESTQPQDVPFKANRDGELALRFSSKVKKLTLGFAFGRNEDLCDIVLKQDKRRCKVSNTHFRIYINDEGVPMLEDCSTNGTFLDDKILRTYQKHVLDHGSKIEVVTFTDSKANYQERAIFVVSVPMRDEETSKQYSENFFKYKVERDIANEKEKGNGVGTVKQNGLRLTHGVVGIGTSRFNHGMQWNGGNKYSVVDQIGKGAFATVYRIATRDEGKIFAAKEIQKGRMNSRNLDEKIENEISIMKKVSHPHVLELYDSHDIGSHLYLILEFMHEGDLMKYFGHHGCIPESMGQTVTKQLCHALGYIHSLNITHRDIKPDNVLIQSLEPLWVKLSDFGLSKMIEDNGGAAMRTFCGTMLYCAPEVYPDYAKLTRMDKRAPKDDPSAARYESNVDIWSLGAVLYHILIGEPPFEGRSGANGHEMLRTVLGNTPDFAIARKQVTDPGVQFLQQCLQVDPSLRPNALSCLQHEWIKSVADVVPDLPAPMSKKTPFELALGISGLSSQMNGSADSWVNDPERAEAFLNYRQASPVSDPDAVELPIQTKDDSGRQKLFGEVGPAGLPDSDIFGANERPVIGNGVVGSDNTTPEPNLAPEEGSAIRSTVSHVQDLNLNSPTHLSTQHPGPTASFLKRNREEDVDADSLMKTSKRIMAKNGPKPRVEYFGRLVPVQGSIKEAEELVLKGPVSAWGRHPGISHVWPNIGDRRIPKTGMDLVFWSPEVATITPTNKFDWVQVDLARDISNFPTGLVDSLEVYLKTRSSLGIRVNGVRLTRAPEGEPWQLVRLYTGDIIEIFNFGPVEFLQYKCVFNVGKSKEERGADAEATVQSCAELQRWSEEMNKQRSTQHQILT